MAKKVTPPSLTFVTILYNAENMIERTLDCLVESIQCAQWKNADILVVDDGSTDKTVAVIEQYKKKTGVSITIHSQKNQGRLIASKAGTELAQGEIVSFMGARVFMHKKSLLWLKEQLARHPNRKVWNCHIEVPRKHNIQAQFWHVLTFIAWRKYLRKPRLISYGSEDFDYYPKGTGAFICPRELLLEGYNHLDSIYDDEKYSSDDTTLIRYIATKERIYMSPNYSADYVARSGWKAFVRHTYDRGSFLLDSYMRPGTRFYVPIIIYFILFIPAVVIVALNLWLLLAIPLGMVVVFIGLIMIGVGGRDALGFCCLAPIFGFIYNLGMWRGLFFFIQAKLN